MGRGKKKKKKTYTELGAEPNTLDVDLHELIKRLDRLVLDAAAAL